MVKQKIGADFGSIMIIVPHQDDEILMAAGIIEQAVSCGLDITVVMVTNGDYDYPHVETGRKRLSESIRALEILGMRRDQFILLGYADTGMPEEDSFLARLYKCEDGDRIFTSRCTDHTYGLEDQAEYHFLKTGEHALYTRNNCKGDIRDVILEYKPDHIFTTSEEDSHGDHSGLFWFVKEILGELKETGYAPHLYSGVVHSCAGDDVWPHRTEDITGFGCPDGFENSGCLKWDERIIFEVPDSMRTADLKENRKAAALAEHVTALKPDAVDFLYSFIKSEELFWEIK